MTVAPAAYWRKEPLVHHATPDTAGGEHIGMDVAAILRDYRRSLAVMDAAVETADHT